MYTASTAFLEALTEAGVDYVFANLGSDHPALVEAIAEARAHGRPIPTLVTCPNEMVAMSAAQGYAQLTGRAQAVFVHVECGTQALAGAVHNAAKARTPILVFAGASPFTQDDELRGSRNEFIQWIQDVHDQRGIVRGYMRYDNEFRTGRNIKQVTHRALQFALSDPKGPVYLMGAREVMEEELDPPAPTQMERWRPLEPGALSPAAIAEIVDALKAAERPLLVTSYAGRNPDAVAPLVALAERIGMGIVESVPSAMNVPHDHPLYLGNQWNQPVQNEALAAADLVLVVDSDVPWIPKHSRPRADARIVHIDVDPLKEQMPLWYIGATRSFRADAATALGQLVEALGPRSRGGSSSRFWKGMASRRRKALKQLEEPDGDVPTPEYLTACIRSHVDDDTIVLNEGITNYHTIFDHMAMTGPGSIFASGGGSLGWNGGAAIGMKLAAPEKTIFALTGDGSYMFSVPSTVHWMARQYRTPFLQVVYNNRGWKAPKFSTLAVHPDGYASRADDIGVAFDPPPDYSAIAAASGDAYARKVERASDLPGVLAEAVRVVREEKRTAVVDVWLPHL